MRISSAITMMCRRLAGRGRGDRQFRRRASRPPGADRATPGPWPRSGKARWRCSRSSRIRQEFFRPRPEFHSPHAVSRQGAAYGRTGRGRDVRAHLRCRAWPSAARRISSATCWCRGLGVSGAVVGADFQFGQGRGGNVATLRYMGEMEGFGVTCFDMVTAAKITGDAPRKRFPPPASAPALKAAQPEEAARLLGHWWAVRRGSSMATRAAGTIGFPTANMHLAHCLAPAFGVYAVRATILENEKPVGRHDGVANFGIRPDVSDRRAAAGGPPVRFRRRPLRQASVGGAGRLYPAGSEVRQPGRA